MKNNILAVIPARGGSKGIPRKNIRCLDGKPLIFYSIKHAMDSLLIDKIIVSTDDPDIAEVAKNYGVEVVERPEELADDETPLDPVVFHAVQSIESKEEKIYDVIITLQPTSPLISTKNIDDMISNFIRYKCDTLISVKEMKHLFWFKNNDEIIPFYKQRKNRQYLEPIYWETGAVMICNRISLTADSRIGKRIIPYVVSDEESIDIDNYRDWWITEKLLQKLRIAFVVDGNINIGMGHIHRTLTLADRFLGHSIAFFTTCSDNFAIELIRKRGYACQETIQDYLIDDLRIFCPNIIINDILDTDIYYMNTLKGLHSFLINFEDLGEGAEIADLVFNALYEKTNCKFNHRFSYEYEFLTDQFLPYNTIEFKDIPNTVLISFGGVDLQNFTCRILENVERLFLKTTLKKCLVIVGAGYAHRSKLMEAIDNLNVEKIELYQSVKNMPGLISQADIAVTSNGRTIYELTALGVPTISIAQNDRETLHLFARYHKGIKYLGIGNGITDDLIINSIIDVANNSTVRRKMYDEQITASKTLKRGIDRVLREIQLKYEEWKYERDQDLQKSN